MYKVSSEIDNNPFLVFSLHNVDLLTEMEKLGIIIKKQSIEIPKINSLFFSKEVTGIEYDKEDAYRKPDFSKLSPLHGPLVALQTPYPPFYKATSADFREKYASVLNRVVKNTQRAAKGKISLPDFFSAA